MKNLTLIGLCVSGVFLLLVFAVAFAGRALEEMTWADWQTLVGIIAPPLVVFWTILIFFQSNSAKREEKRLHAEAEAPYLFVRAEKSEGFRSEYRVVNRGGDADRVDYSVTSEARDDIDIRDQFTKFLFSGGDFFITVDAEYPVFQEDQPVHLATLAAGRNGIKRRQEFLISEYGLPMVRNELVEE